MTSELRPEMEVASAVYDECREKGIRDGGALIKADREAVRAEMSQALIATGEAAATHLKEATKFKALAETLAGAVREIKDSWDWWQVDTYDRCSSVVEDAINEALRQYKEARDAS